MFFRIIPLIISLVPLLTINISFLIAASLEHIPSCFPYLDGCTSISSTGRQPPENYVFRAAMMPVAVFMALYWVLNYHWLRVLGDKVRWPRIAILILGIVAAIFLISYTTVLGAIGEIYQTQRRIGVTVFFSFTFLAQLILTSRLWELKKKYALDSLGQVPETQLLLCSTMLLLGLISIPLSIITPGADNIIEWNFALLVNMHYLTSYFGWKNTAFDIHFAVNLTHHLNDRKK